MSEIVQRMAKAIEAEIFKIEPGSTPQMRLENAARAALQAAREPTEAMEKAGAHKWDEDWCTQTNALNMWQAMIDEAVKD
ncbi:hypothetical protein IVB43_23800 [Bradyrhizobium sp. 48]|uniref:hypothetical protein n=1 Tax=Bradyrhizobium sp. 48 TaxID=2782676 RepID=UPI001FFBD1D7|nr:hypothetical protein [Bradyrhizobium sp. 48]MCK1445413.1 hypothetical protein [Bradyrhizobium sp. 48]